MSVALKEERKVRSSAGCAGLILMTLLMLGGFAGLATYAYTHVEKAKHLKQLPPLSRVAQLHEKHRLDPAHTDQRLIIVGDVHGMYDELMQLMHKVDYDKSNDVIVFLGDMITKGYDSLGVVDFAIKHGAYCVRGNHEDEILSMYASHYDIKMPKTFPPFASATAMTAGDRPTATLKPTKGPPVPDKPKKASADKRSDAAAEAAEAIEMFNAVDMAADINGDDLSSEEGSEQDPTLDAQGARNEERDLPLVKKMKKRHVKYLASCPAILQLGQVSKRGVEAVAVHGGLLWDELDLEKQDIYDVLRIRSIVPPDYSKGSENPEDGIAWFAKWNDEQLQRKKQNRLEVFYGHDASKGLQLHRYSKGLDTRCQRGGKLSAYVVTVAHDGHYHEELVQIDCDSQ